jgi:hypothetical protein
VYRKTAFALVAAFVATIAWATPASAATSTWLRLAHLSPDTPEVDIYLAPYGRTDDSELILSHVGYGAMSPYRTMRTGYYTVSMRPAGAASSTPAVISTDIRLSTSKAYTLAGIGLNKALALRLFNDDLTPPAANQSRVRLIQAADSAPAINVTTESGAKLASSTPFATTTSYAALPAGATLFAIEPLGGSATASTVPVNLRGGTVLSVLVVNGANNGLTVRTVLDAEGMSQMPAGAVDTGKGGMAPRTWPWWIVAVAAIALVKLLVRPASRKPSRRSS